MANINSNASEENQDLQEVMLPEKKQFTTSILGKKIINISDQNDKLNKLHI
jgi:hypothetical protein